MTAVPPWPDPDDEPLHGTDLPDGGWWACQYPERPYDPTFTCWDWRCHGCFRHGEATLAQHPDVVADDLRRLSLATVPLARSVQDAQAWHNLPAR